MSVLNYQIEAQILGWKSKLFFVNAASVEDALKEAGDFFGIGWTFRITDPDGVVVYVDKLFDLEWEESEAER